MRRLFLMTGVLLIAVLLATACAGGGAAQPTTQPLPQAKTGSGLRKVQDRGKLIVGVRSDIPTFGHINLKTNQFEGFEVAMAKEIAARLLGNPSKIEFKETASKDRIPFLQNGMVDIVLASMTITEARMKDVDFSVVYYVSGQRLLVNSDSTIRGTSDLNPSHKVGVAKGSTSGDNIRKVTKAQIVEYETWADAVKALVAKQVDVITNDDSSLYGYMLDHSGLKVVGSAFVSNPVGAGIAKNSPELLEAVNGVIKDLKSSGKWKTLWLNEVGSKIGVTIAPDPPGDEWKR